MPCLQPEIMVVDGLHQDRSNTGAVGAQGVGINLVAHQSRFGCGNPVFDKALIDAFGEGLFRMGNAGNTLLAAKNLHPVFVAVGNYTQLDIGFYHFFQPGTHLRCGCAGGIRHDGIVKVQHQKFDSPTAEQFDGYICECRNNDLG